MKNQIVLSSKYFWWYLYLFDLLLNIVRKQSVCVSRRVSIWLRMTLILTRRPIIIFAEKNIQLRFVMFNPHHCLLSTSCKDWNSGSRFISPRKLNHNTLFVLLAVYLQRIDFYFFLNIMREPSLRMRTAKERQLDYHLTIVIQQ